MADGTDTQTIVNNLRAAIAKLSIGTVRTATFAGQTFTKESLGDMTKQLTFWEARLKRETAPADQPSRRAFPQFDRVGTGFSGAGR